MRSGCRHGDEHRRAGWHPSALRETGQHGPGFRLQEAEEFQGFNVSRILALLTFRQVACMALRGACIDACWCQRIGPQRSDLLRDCRRPTACHRL
jgi:hypothetical protein